MSKKIQIYSDGACRGNPGPGGWGVLLIYDGTEKEIYGGELETTNNRMELLAVIIGLEALKKEGQHVQVYSDSKYVVDAVEKGYDGHYFTNSSENVNVLPSASVTAM